MEAKEKGAILDAEDETFLENVKCTTPYAEPLAITTTTEFEVSHEHAYDSDVDEAPHAAAAFMANLMQTGPSTGQGTSITRDTRGEQLDANVDLVIDDHDNTIPYHQYQLNNEVESVPTDVSYVVPGGIYDLQKSALGHRNPLYLKSAQLCRPTLYLGDVIVDPVHTPFRVTDSEETLVQAELVELRC
nr:hypothetical protein [Tanacetum cinerariifolium]